MPHGHCYLWDPAMVWTNVVSDLLIGLAYVSISVSLYILVRKIKLPFSAVIISFGVFIGACGGTHFMEVWNLWHADYWPAAYVKIITAMASVATGIWIIRLKPQFLKVAEATRLSELRRAQLEMLNEELSKSNAALKEQQKLLAHSAKMSALGEMAGGIAHEINSPLSIITVHANQLERFLKRGSLTPELIEKEAQLIAGTAKRIGEIIKGLRAFAREGENDPFEAVSASSLLRDALVLCQTRFKAHAVDLLSEEALASAAILECRSVQVIQVLVNLLGNAFDAVQSLPERWVRVDIREPGGDVEFSVTDSGTGIAEAIQSKMMQPFFTTKEVGKGTGLGLSISKGIAETHSGTLFLDGSSRNTRFVLRLPKKHREKVSAQ